MCRGTFNRANQKQWKHGDLVIHDREAKEHKMLRVVTFVREDGVCRTQYAYPKELPQRYRNKVFYDKSEYLHDPKRFGIPIKPNKPQHKTQHQTQENNHEKACP